SVSCEVQEEETAPELPPESSFIMDLSDFTDQNKSFPIDDTTNQKNFQHAAGHVILWNLFITIGMAIPVISFLEAFKHEAVLVETGHWKWSYNFRAGGVLHLAELHGIVSDSVTWEMYITKENFFDNYLWYSGKGDFGVSGGYWIIRKGPDNDVPLLKIDWERKIADSTGNITYTNVEPGGAENGGYIKYGTTTDEPYNAFYDIYNKGEDHLVEIEWKRGPKEGRVKNEKWFKDTEWHCWDSTLYNINCN
ncbi:MAG: hypothetical protein JXB17_10180, partial [Bacteroidales bacterium]|nr:hypothetical protein [Bacteroidales bacterium]